MAHKMAMAHEEKDKFDVDEEVFFIKRILLRYEKQLNEERRTLQEDKEKDDPAVLKKAAEMTRVQHATRFMDESRKVFTALREVIYSIFIHFCYTVYYVDVLGDIKNNVTKATFSKTMIDPLVDRRICSHTFVGAH